MTTLPTTPFFAGVTLTEDEFGYIFLESDEWRCRLENISVSGDIPRYRIKVTRPKRCQRTRIFEGGLAAALEHAVLQGRTVVRKLNDKTVTPNWCQEEFV